MDFLSAVLYNVYCYQCAVQIRNPEYYQLINVESANNQVWALHCT